MIGSIDKWLFNQRTAPSFYKRGTAVLQFWKGFDQATIDNPVNSVTLKRKFAFSKAILNINENLRSSTQSGRPPFMVDFAF